MVEPLDVKCVVLTRSSPALDNMEVLQFVRLYAEMGYFLTLITKNAILGHMLDVQHARVMI
jgi:hypothetical protein